MACSSILSGSAALVPAPVRRRVLPFSAARMQARMVTRASATQDSSGYV